jgi:hypothetical protein
VMIKSNPVARTSLNQDHPHRPPSPSFQPILFANLGIHFADFPYLHSSLNYRLLTLETCCGLWYDHRGGALYASRIFTRVLMRSTYAENQHTLMHLCWPISEQVHSRSLCALRRKDNSSVGHQYLSPVTPALPPIEQESQQLTHINHEHYVFTELPKKCHKQSTKHSTQAVAAEPRPYFPPSRKHISTVKSRSPE